MCSNVMFNTVHAPRTGYQLIQTDFMIPMDQKIYGLHYDDMWEILRLPRSTKPVAVKKKKSKERWAGSKEHIKN